MDHMNILISGASGLIGTSLSAHLKSQGHQVHTLKRNQPNANFNWNPDEGFIQLDPNIQLDAVINLNGVNIGDKRWNASRKAQIIESRVNSTQLLTSTIAKLAIPPKVFINASAIGFYGDTGSTLSSEHSPAGDNYLTHVVTQWEAAAKPLNDTGIRTVFIRSGVVISEKGGALKKMLMPFKFGLGGRIGTGQQFMSWISLTDELRAIEYLLNHDIHGPVNLTAPNPVTNQVFTKALGQALKRYTPFPMPSIIVKILFGEMGKLLLLGSNRIEPGILSEHGFKFLYPDIHSALKHTLSKN
jgi:uncharacterized protein (TIGR01777 family)